MAVRIGINGFGRIGMLVAKAAMNRGDLEVVAANDLMPFDSLANLFKHDSTHGIWHEDVSFDGNVLRVGDHEIKTFAERDPAQIPWGDVGADIVVESTGVFTEPRRGGRPYRGRREEGDHLRPRQGRGRHLRLQGEPRGLRSGQRRDHLQRELHDELHHPDGEGPAGQLRHRAGLHDDRARLHQRPEPAGRRPQGPAARPLGPEQHRPDLHGRRPDGRRDLPDLEGKVDGMSMRVPVPDGSITDFVAEVSAGGCPGTTSTRPSRRPPTASSRACSSTPRRRSSPATSSATRRAACSTRPSRCPRARPSRYFGWYDNEWGYSNRTCDLAVYVGEKL